MRDSLIRSKLKEFGFTKQDTGIEIITDIMVKNPASDNIEPLTFSHGTVEQNLYDNILKNIAIFTDYIEFTEERKHININTKKMDSEFQHYVIDNKNIVAINAFLLGKNGGKEPLTFQN